MKTFVLKSLKEKTYNIKLGLVFLLIKDPLLKVMFFLKLPHNFNMFSTLYLFPSITAFQQGNAYHKSKTQKYVKN